MPNELKDAAQAVARVDDMLGKAAGTTPTVTQAAQELALALLLRTTPQKMQQDSNLLRSVRIATGRIVRFRKPLPVCDVSKGLLNGATFAVFMRDESSVYSRNGNKRKRMTLSGRLHFSRGQLFFTRVTRN